MSGLPKSWLCSQHQIRACAQLWAITAARKQDGLQPTWVLSGAQHAHVTERVNGPMETRSQYSRRDSERLGTSMQEVVNYLLWIWPDKLGDTLWKFSFLIFSSLCLHPPKILPLQTSFTYKDPKFKKTETGRIDCICQMQVWEERKGKS